VNSEGRIEKVMLVKEEARDGTLSHKYILPLISALPIEPPT